MAMTRNGEAFGRTEGSSLFFCGHGENHVHMVSNETEELGAVIPGQ
jgi:hypothetical protein